MSKLSKLYVDLSSLPRDQAQEIANIFHDHSFIFDATKIKPWHFVAFIETDEYSSIIERHPEFKSYVSAAVS